MAVTDPTKWGRALARAFHRDPEGLAGVDYFDREAAAAGLDEGRMAAFVAFRVGCLMLADDLPAVDEAFDDRPRAVSGVIHC